MVAFALAAISAPALAAKITPPVEPWAQTRSDMPADPAVRFGVLPNGMRYAIMRNKTPPGEVAIRFRIDAGSLEERDDQQGLAHFLEHMSFRGSNHVPEGEVWRSLQRLGLAIGADNSAYTSETQTFYVFDLLKATDESIEESFLHLRETASELLLKQSAMDIERGAILGEERVRDTLDMRAAQEIRPYFFKGQLVADRFAIGKVDTIEHAPVKLIADFYHAYYRPERATLIVVGDIDPDAIEAKIKAHFADWRPVGPPGTDPVTGPPLKRGADAKLVVNANIPRATIVGWVAPYDNSPDTAALARHYWIQRIGLNILNRRFQVAANSANRPFLNASVTSQNVLRSARLTQLNVDIDPAHWRAALTAAETMRRQAVEFGVQQVEVDREVTQMLASYRSAAANEATRQTSSLASELLTAADRNDVFSSPSQDLALLTTVTKNLSAADVSAALKGAFDGSGPLLYIASPTPIAGGVDTIKSALAEADSAPIMAPPPEAKLVWPYASFGKPGTVAERRHIDEFDISEVRFDNNVRLTIKRTAFSKDQVLVGVKIGGGLLELPRDRSTTRWAADGVLLLGGLNKLTLDDIQRVLASKVYGLNFYTGEDGFVFSGVTRPEDIDTQLQLFAAYTTDPAWRPQAFDRIVATAAPQLNTLMSRPDGVKQRDTEYLLRNSDPRWASPTRYDLMVGKIADVRQILDAPLANGAIEVTMVGDVDIERAIAAVASTFGALPKRADKFVPAPGALVSRFPAPTATPVVHYHKGRPDQGIALIAWPGVDIMGDLQKPRDMRILERILETRLFEQFRVATGNTYVTQNSLETSQVFPGYGYISSLVEVAPDKMDLFFTTVSAITKDLREHEVSQDELERARRPRVDLFTEEQKTNGYWYGFLLGLQANPERLDIIRTTIPDLKHVTAADVRKAAQTYLVDDKAWRMMIVPMPATDPAAPKPPRPLGSATISCVMAADNRPTDCRVIREEPAGVGLGAEALLTAANLHLDPKSLKPPVAGRNLLNLRLPIPQPGE